eukprot:COSAG02_NODE_14524_length_1262_cov_2.889080_1_plen_67_part_01
MPSSFAPALALSGGAGVVESALELELEGEGVREGTRRGSFSGRCRMKSAMGGKGGTTPSARTGRSGS